YLKGMAGVSFFGLLNGFSSFASLRIDAIMVNEFFDTAAVGIYTTTFHFGILVILHSRALLKIASPLIAEALKNEDKTTLNDIYYKSCINQLLAGTFLLLGIWVNIDNVFIILPPEFEAGKWVILYIGMANIIKMSTGVSEALMAYSRHYKMVTWFMLAFLVITIITNLIFIPIMGISGAALASMVAVGIYGFMRFLFVKHHFGLQPYNTKFLIIPGLGLLTATLVYFIPHTLHYLADIAMRSTLATILFCISIYLLRCSEEFNAALLHIWEKIKR
ncbi:MAG: polysaccharide biosynthesis C-terminal domain-containing protein, partial [Cyclobacteriaceae bacterium]